MEYLEVSSTEEDEIGKGITNEYLNLFAEGLDGIEKRYKEYNKSLIMDLYNYSNFYPIEYSITGSSGTYTVEYLGESSLIEGFMNKTEKVKNKIGNIMNSIFGDSDKLSTIRSEFNDAMRNLNSINDVLEDIEDTELDDLYAIQLVSQYNKSNHGVIIDEIHNWYLNYEKELGEEEPETNIRDTSEYEDYIKIMDQATKVNKKATDAYKNITEGYLANEREAVNESLIADSIYIDKYRIKIAYANELLENAIKKCGELKDAIESLETSKKNWGNALDKCPKDEEFTVSTRAELDSISELFNANEVDKLEDRLSEINDVLEKVLNKVDKYKYGSKKLYEIVGIEYLKAAVTINNIPDNKKQA